MLWSQNLWQCRERCMLFYNFTLISTEGWGKEPAGLTMLVPASLFAGASILVHRWRNFRNCEVCGHLGDKFPPSLAQLKLESCYYSVCSFLQLFGQNHDLIFVTDHRCSGTYWKWDKFILRYPWKQQMDLKEKPGSQRLLTTHLVSPQWV